MKTICLTHLFIPYSSMFIGAIMAYKKDHGLDATGVIDTPLLRIMDIPLDPIADGLAKYRKWHEDGRTMHLVADRDSLKITE
jgi:hypothetical protein